MEFVNNVENNICHDCAKEISIENEEIKGGVYLEYENGDKKINIFKCDGCYEKNKALTNYQPCEVYSRVVGYIRPVQQWHKGKKQEYSERQEFNLPGSSCC